MTPLYRIEFASTIRSGEYPGPFKVRRAKTWKGATRCAKGYTKRDRYAIALVYVDGSPDSVARYFRGKLVWL